jgi:iron complex outermembrane receptor protein
MNSQQSIFRLSSGARHVSQALALMCAAAPWCAMAQDTLSLDAVVISGKTPIASDATRSAPSQGSLSARSAQSTVSDDFIRNHISPVSDYTQVLAMTPGVFAYSPNGVGLGDSKITIRGLPDSFTVMSFDGIPFNDTNGVSHHSWVFFPSQFLGGATVDRSPGSASTIGQAAFAGSIDLRSRLLEPDRRSSVTASYGIWRTRLVGFEQETGQFGSDGTSNLLVNVQQMKSDGYQTYNRQDRNAWSAKYQTALNPTTQLTIFGASLELTTNTPNTKGVTRANYNAGGYNVLLSGDPSRADYYGYNFYDVYTNFFYAGIKSDLGDGWLLEDKAYLYQYHNKQNYNGTTITASSAVDKLNAYVTLGNLLRASKTSAMGTLRTGLWLDHANSDRHQIPADPRTWVTQATPNFTETYQTTTLQPYVEYEFKLSEALRVTPGMKYALYKQAFLHLQDNGGAVGTLGGTYNATTGVITGGAPSLGNSVTYHDLLPSLDAHYLLSPNWSAYAQFAAGDEIPSTSVFDVKNAQVSPNPKPTKAKTVQVGTVWSTPRMTLSADVYHTKLDGAYTPTAPDAAGNIGYVLSGTEVAKGVEAEANFVLGSGFGLYVNGTVGSLKYQDGQWVAGAPRDTETIGANWRQGGFDVSLSANRVGRQYNDGKLATQHQTFTIDPIVLTNLFANYRIPHPMHFVATAKLQLGVNNLLNKHSITGVASPATNSSSVNPLGTDLLTVLPARSVSMTATLDF